MLLHDGVDGSEAEFLQHRVLILQTSLDLPAGEPRLGVALCDFLDGGDVRLRDD